MDLARKKMRIRSRLFPIIFLCIVTPVLFAQPQFFVEGAEGVDTVAKIMVTSNVLFTDIVALYSKSEPTPGRGIGGSFFGGITGIVGESHSGTGIMARSHSAYGIRGVSDLGYGGYFKGGGGIDIVLAGTAYGGGSGADEGVISTDPLQSSSDMWLISNDAIVFQLDKDDDEAGTLEIKNSTQTTVFQVDENGTTRISGELNTHATGTANMLPVSYGNIQFSGVISSGSGNFNVVRYGTGLYRIEIVGESIDDDNYLVLISLKEHGQVQWFPSAGDLAISTSENGVNADKNFCFLIYKP